MKLGIRSRLFWVSVALIVVVGGSSAIFLEEQVRAWLVDRTEAELVRRAESARQLLAEVTAAAGTEADFDAFADRIGIATGLRITLIASDGRVLGDSAVAAEGLVEVDNHGTRPEVLNLAGQSHGVSRRHSTTLGTDLLYLAVRAPPGSGVMALRVAMPLTEVDAMVVRLRVLVGIACLLGLAAALFMSGLASHLVSRDVRELERDARELADGTRKARLLSSEGAELQSLAHSLNRLRQESDELRAALTQQRARFEAVLDGMGDAVVVIDATQHIRVANQRAHALLRATPGLEGRLLVDALRDPELHEAMRGLQRADSISVELRRVGPERRQVSVRASRLRSGEGAVLVMHDVTSLRRLEAVRRDFIANASHELRTPVSVVQANAETLLDGALDDPRARDFIDAIWRNARRLSRIISDLLDLSALESGSYRISLEAVELRAAAARAVEPIEQAARERGTTIADEISPELAVTADPAALEQVLLNLVSNAVTHTPPGSQVILSARMEGDAVRLDVCDNGPGIPPEHRDRLFERFYRVDPGRSRSEGGTGLGLAIVKHLVAAMGGSVGMEPASPHGCVFWVRLPSESAGTASPD